MSLPVQRPLSRRARTVSSNPRSARRLLARVAGITAAGVAVAGVATALAPAAPALATSLGSRAVAIAAAQQGDPYVYGAAGPNAFDCSGLVRYVYGQLGIDLPHNSAAQYAAVEHISRSSMQPGDIVFFADSSGYVYHDGIYAGGGRMWAAPHTGTTVQLEAIYTSAYLVGRPYGSGSASSSGSSAGPSRHAARGYHVGGGHPLLRLGARGPAVRTAQRLLHVTADGEFGPMTRAATVRFQRAHHLFADGQIGRHTWAALTRGSAQQVVYRSGHPTLQQGSHGPAVRVVQHAVGVRADGDFGPVTRAAVERFQARHGLAVDGVVGPQTWAAFRGTSQV